MLFYIYVIFVRTQKKTWHALWSLRLISDREFTNCRFSRTFIISVYFVLMHISRLPPGRQRSIASKFYRFCLLRSAALRWVLFFFAFVVLNFLLFFLINIKRVLQQTFHIYTYIRGRWGDNKRVYIYICVQKSRFFIYSTSSIRCEHI